MPSGITKRHHYPGIFVAAALILSTQSLPVNIVATSPFGSIASPLSQSWQQTLAQT
jgi:hypothetical protein